MHRSLPLRWCLMTGLLVLASIASARQASLSIAHFAPGAPPLTFEVDGARLATAVAYGQLKRDLPITGGTRLVRVSDAAGTTVAERTLHFSGFDPVVLFAAGNGSDAEPYAIVAQRQLPYPVTHDNGSIVQQADLGLYPAQSADTIIRRRQQCTGTGGGGGARPATSLAHRVPQGWVPPELSYVRQSSCTYWLSVGDHQVELGVEVEPLQRLLVVAAGDGDLQPFQLHAFALGSEPLLPVEPASERINGMWVDPGQPGLIVLLAYDPDSTDEDQGIEGTVLTPGDNGPPKWLGFRDAQVVEVLGGNADGNRATIEFAHGMVDALIHSCDEISLLASSAPWVGFPALARLHRILPIGDCRSPGNR